MKQSASFSASSCCNDVCMFEQASLIETKALLQQSLCLLLLWYMRKYSCPSCTSFGSTSKRTSSGSTDGSHDGVGGVRLPKGHQPAAAFPEKSRNATAVVQTIAVRVLSVSLGYVLWERLRGWEWKNGNVCRRRDFP